MFKHQFHNLSNICNYSCAICMLLDKGSLHVFLCLNVCCFGTITTCIKIKLLEIEYLPQELLKMNNLLHLVKECCPLLELPFKKIDEERETGRELNTFESFHDDDKCLFIIQWFSTETLELLFSECVCPNLRSLYLPQFGKSTQIRGLCGMLKLQHLDV